MGTIKIELDIPEFEKELNIGVTLKKDGSIVYNIPGITTTPTYAPNPWRPMCTCSCSTTSTEASTIGMTDNTASKKKKKSETSGNSGNLMNSEF